MWSKKGEEAHWRHSVVVWFLQSRHSPFAGHTCILKHIHVCSFLVLNKEILFTQKWPTTTFQSKEHVNEQRVMWSLVLTVTGHRKHCFWWAWCQQSSLTLLLWFSKSRIGKVCGFNGPQKEKEKEILSKWATQNLLGSLFHLLDCPHPPPPSFW